MYRAKNTVGLVVRSMVGLAICFAGSGVAHGDYRAELDVEYVSGSIDSSGSYSIPDYTPPPSGNVDPPVDPPTTGPITGPITGPSESFGADEDYTGWALSGKVFLESVDTSKGPFQLAEFLSRSSSVGGIYGMTETDRTDIETEFWEVFTRVVVSEALVLEANFGGEEIDSDIADFDADVYRVAVGYYVGQNTQVRIGYDVEDVETTDFDRWAVDIEHVQQLENGMTWQASALYGTVGGDSSFGRNDDGSDLELALSWFFNDNFGIGANFDMNERDVSGDTDFYSFWANYYPTDKISLELAYYSEDNDDFDAEGDGIIFKARYRF